jgi:crotonobetaine/carnitine-CoA ligase
VALHPTGDRTMSDLLRECVEAFGDTTALVFESAEGEVSELTYRELGDRVGRCAAALTGLGVQVGDRVVVHLRNCPEMLVAWFATAHCGAVFVPANVANAAAELEHVVGFTRATLVITEPALHDVMAEAVAATGLATEIVVTRGPVPGRRRLDDVVPDGDPPPPAAAGAEDLAELIFTSGTTRKPKAVMLSHANCLRAGQHAVQCLWLQEGERCLTALPLFHVNAQAMSALAALTVGGTLVLIEEFRASRFWRQVRDHRATQTAIVAMQLRTLLAQPAAPGEREHALRRVFYAINVTDSEKEAFEERFGVSLINGYGLSEAMTLVSVSPVVGPRRWPSVGLPAPGRSVLLLDDLGNEVPQGEVGEIVVEGTPGRSIMLGYFEDPASTGEAIRDGRLHTGDNAYADEHGFLFFFDRKKDMIKRAGENVSALEVESALLEHPAVAEAAVVGIPDPIRDEAVAAVVVLESDAAPSEDELREHCSSLLARFKVPTVVVVEDQLPKTSIGKVRKDVLRKNLLQETAE